MDQSNVSRRGFIKTSGAVTAASLVAMGTNYAHAAGSDVIRTGVIGCGGRGSGAAGDHMAGAGFAGVKAQIVAAGDMFPDRVSGVAKKFNLPKEKVFTGFDAYKGVLDAGVDCVILATPPGFRPMHFAAAVAAGKHVFMEKPVGTDPTALRIVFDAAKVSEDKKLCVVAGTQRRHETNYIDTIKCIHDGEIGDVLHMSVYWNGGGIWFNKRQPGQTDMEAQLRNWYHYVWLCGDQICEQHVHNLDVMNWVMKSHPISAYGLGGRQCRDKEGQIPGEIWDHFGIEYEFANGGRALSFCRHWPQSTENVSEFAIGTKGTSNPGGWVKPFDGKQKGFANKRSGYQQEHADLLTAITSGKPINEAKQVAESTLTAVMGRMSCYTGKKISWDQAYNSKLDIFPKELSMDAKMPAPHVAQPGDEKLI